MTATLIDGKQLAKKIKARVTEQVSARLSKGLRAPCLVVVLVGKHAPSQTYIKNKQASCNEVGINSKLIELEETTSENALLSLLEKLNHDDSVDGILVQLPLPPHIDTNKIINAISPTKDVDGFHHQTQFLPCTALAVMEILRDIQVNPANKQAVVVGQSIIVGKPVSKALEKAGANVIRCDKSTKDLPAAVGKAEILVVAIGKPGFIKAEWLKPGVVVIDVGINHVAHNHIVGDVEFEAALNKATFITPVPGGVGPITVATLMKNTLIAAK